MIRLLRLKLTFRLALLHLSLRLKRLTPILLTNTISRSNSNKKKALLKYISYKSLTSRVISHANQVEGQCIVQALDSLGYDVEVIPYTYSSALLTTLRRFDLVFGINISGSKADVVIEYFTGSSTVHQKNATSERLANFKIAHLVKLKNERYLYNGSKIKTGILLGNNTTRLTYPDDYNLYKVNAIAQSHLGGCESSCVLNTSMSRFKFLWIGSNALTLKGLDICLAVFSTLSPPYELHILSQYDELFWAAQCEAFGRSNIIYHGFLNSSSPEFSDVCRICQWTLGTSLSEGQSTSVLAAMSHGCIPILTDNCGIDNIREDLRIRSLDGSSLLSAIKYIRTLSVFDTEMLTISTLDRTRRYHCKERFIREITEKIKSICTEGV